MATWNEAPERRGCIWLLGMLASILLLMSALGAIGITIGVQQPGQIWAVPVGQGYFAIGRLVSQECLRMQARGGRVACARSYGAVLYLPHMGAGGYDVEYTLFAIPDPRPPR